MHVAALQSVTVVAPQRAAALAESMTIDLDSTDVEVYGRQKRGVAFDHQGQRWAARMWRPRPIPPRCWPRICSWTTRIPP
jgi:hypothetical protein